jgi:hypothetical protein
LQQIQKRIAAFFYGSFIRKDVMALGGFHPETVEVAKLSGYDITFDPHANIFRSDQHAVCGVLVYPSHEELNKMYSRDGVGVFLPEAVVVETSNNRMLPAICYMPPGRNSESADLAYVELIIQAAREHGFPEWYLSHLEALRSQGIPTPKHSFQRIASGSR